MLAPADNHQFIVCHCLCPHLRAQLLHREERLERCLGRFILAALCYGHFDVEHNQGHHLTVGTDADPATARYGESFWSFLARCLVASYQKAWGFEWQRLQREGLSWHHNEVVRYAVASLTVGAALTATFGRGVLALFIGQSLMGEQIRHVCRRAGNVNQMCWQ